MWSATVSLESPYNFEQVLQRLSIDPLNIIDINEQLVKVPIRLNNEQDVVTIKATGTFEKPAFQLSGTMNTAEAEERIREIFGWNVQMEQMLTHFRSTSLRPLSERYAYTPIVLDFDPFASLARCIIHQQLNLKFAFTLTQRFYTTFGTSMDGVWFPPSPERVANISVSELRELQFSQRKAEYVIGLAEKIVDGTINIGELRHLSNEEIEKKLLPLRGIGPWTVQNFLLFGLGRKNLFPKADIGLQRAIQQLFKLETKPTDEFMEQLKNEWEPYGSYASLYLWRSIE
ncbi:DNA-3-methyladenine glycosylase family protein [Ectobacillus sp. sgz5001026]|uniref:DNA-3-methyladenine glycosylase family protein n=1 Tax=Ectobacillus sp. sgz5001026 TaxID=3242473 RepID=UPI0036D3D59F